MVKYAVEPHRVIENASSAKLLGVIGKQLGYSLPERGFCNGFTLQWLNARLIRQEEIFNNRLKLILRAENLVEIISHAREKVLNRDELSSEERAYLDILSFYEGILLFQSPTRYPDFFESNLEQFDFEQISLIAWKPYFGIKLR